MFRKKSRSRKSSRRSQSGDSATAMMSRGVVTVAICAGDYTFRVVNKNVHYELGFWLRSKGHDWRNPLHKVTKTSVSGGGLTQGTTKDYEVTLKPGEYVYSCPLNTTPDYPAGG